MPRDIPIIFSAPMVLALLAGRKTMTRRLAHAERKTRNPAIGESLTYVTRSPWCDVRPGDRLWVRESIKGEPDAAGFDGLRYLADNLWAGMESDQSDRFMDIWYYRDKRGASIPSIHMPRWASRLTLFVSAVKVEPLHSISPQDAWDEGVERRSQKVRQMWLFGANSEEREAIYKRACVWEFEDLWKSLHGVESWDANPEVVALSFNVIKANIDAPEARVK